MNARTFIKLLRTSLGVLVALTLTGGGLLLNACNTTEGAGRDIKAAGESIENAAERHK